MPVRSGLNWLLNIVGGASVVGASFAITLTILNYMDRSAPTSTANRTELAETIAFADGLPPLPSALGAAKWSAMEGLVAHPAPIPAAAAGQQALLIVSTPTDGNKMISALFAGQLPRRYRVVVWVKPGSAGRLLLELRGGGADGLATFDVGHRAAVGIQGSLQAHGLEQADNGWLKMWAEMTLPIPLI